MHRGSVNEWVVQSHRRASNGQSGEEAAENKTAAPSLTMLKQHPEFLENLCFSMKLSCKPTPPNWSCVLSRSVVVTVTKCYTQCGLKTKEIYFSRSWGLGSKSRSENFQCVERSPSCIVHGCLLSILLWQWGLLRRVLVPYPWHFPKASFFIWSFVVSISTLKYWGKLRHSADCKCHWAGDTIVKQYLSATCKSFLQNTCRVS